MTADLKTDAPPAAGCSKDNDCPDHSACENRACINPCVVRDPCAATANCRVANHKPICTCPDGYIGSPTTDCRLREFDPRDIVAISALHVIVLIFSSPT